MSNNSAGHYSARRWFLMASVLVRRRRDLLVLGGRVLKANIKDRTISFCGLEGGEMRK